MGCTFNIQLALGKGGDEKLNTKRTEPDADDKSVDCV